MRYYFFGILILTFHLKGLAQPDSQKDVDMNGMLENCSRLLNSDLDSAEIQINHLLQVAMEKDSIYYESRAYIYLGHLNSYRAIEGSALKYYQKALEKCKELKDDRKEYLTALIQENIGFLMYENAKYDEAISYLNQGLEYFNKVQKASNIANSKLAIALIYIQQKKPVSEIENLLEEVEEIARKEGLDYVFTETLNTKALLYIENKTKLDTAIDILKECVEFVKSGNNEDYFSLGLAYSSLTQAYSLIEKPNEALAYSDSSILVFSSYEEIQELSTVYESRQKIYADLNDYKGALESSQELLKLKELMFNTRQSELLNELQTKYETEQKEAKIASLEQEAEIQSLQIRERNQLIVIGIISFILILAIIYFLNVQRNIRRRKRQVELEQRFLRSQLNPHFISNALVAVQSSLLENNTEDASTYLSVFSRLMREILENSREEYITVEAEISMLTSYLDIHKRRLNHSFDYDIEVDEDIDEELDSIPPMFIQPFIENAIEHGLPTDAQGHISISISKQAEHIYVSIKDNGSGITYAKHATSDHRSLSTSIIEERISLFNESLKHKIKLLIENWHDSAGKIGGTLVELYVPVR